MKQDSKLIKRLEQERAFLFEKEENCKPLSMSEQEAQYNAAALTDTSSTPATDSNRLTLNFKKLNNANLIRPIAIRPLGNSEIFNGSNNSERLINKFTTVLSFSNEQSPIGSIVQVERPTDAAFQLQNATQSPLTATNRQHSSFIKRRQTIPRASNSKLIDRDTFSTINELRLFTNHATHYHTPSHCSSYASSYYTSPSNSFSSASSASPYSHRKEHFSYLTRPYLNLIKMKMQKMKSFQENYQTKSERRASHSDYKSEKNSKFVSNDNNNNNNNNSFTLASDFDVNTKTSNAKNVLNSKYYLSNSCLSDGTVASPAKSTLLQIGNLENILNKKQTSNNSLSSLSAGSSASLASLSSSLSSSLQCNMHVYSSSQQDDDIDIVEIENDLNY
jgi:hypothetical protein